MIKVYIPINNYKEREYILNIILGEFLGVNYILETRDNQANWELVLNNGKKIIIEDGFFNEFTTELSYLKNENIPQKIALGVNKFIPEKDIPILFGGDRCKVISENEIICGIDIFASSFFMLSRWEEYANKKRDRFNRFSAEYSIASKFNFLNRPVVNEYTEMLWTMLCYLGCKQERKERNFELMVTHDVDLIKKYTSVFSGFREIIGDIIKRKNLKQAYFNLKQKTLVSLKLKKDPYDTFNWIMDLSGKRKVKSYFFFMAEGQTEFDNLYKINDPFVKKIKDKIEKRGHNIGIHPTYNSYNSAEQFAKEKEELKKVLGIKVNYGRQHCLRFSVPETWQVWEDNNMNWDSTLGYAEKEGFRAGVCYEYSTFNILTRKQLKLKEIPLLAMEVSFYKYQNFSPEEMIEKIQLLKEKVEKYKGVFVLLWHNNNFESYSLQSYKKVYENILQ